ncbi:organoarsenical effux MFS transporter ArsJ [Aestuariispira insulae]|uniref:MFS transporter n=1 Tax=Aestuariispira insulae TaxID=1461337 RepID=A0A3D9HHZ7_9PROT|nr:organoarsenical effux MFS transporter ArsJ [Aestuariispira insulae]RED49045.1 MFS transporter [Aestuariispira insulae]
MANIRDYIAVTAAYWGFTLTDGALRMLVLLHFHALGYSPLDLAFLFLLYEAMGVVTNFLGGWIGTRFGLRSTLYAGLTTQIVALTALSFLNPGWVGIMSVAYVMGAQALSGVAKDLTKMSSKSAVKLVVKETEGSNNLLFKWVALLTGSKNALKGVGFLMGGLLLEYLGFQQALWAMAAGLVLILITVIVVIRQELGKAKRKIKGAELFSKSREINYLSFARVFLFASRDVWFVVGLPIYLYSSLNWRFDQVSAFMALWIVGYGIIQAVVPRFTRKIDSNLEGARSARRWAGGLLLVMLALTAALQEGVLSPVEQDMVLLGGLLFFGGVFAVNSALHSYLIVAYAERETVALSVGFYYMANAVGRFAGTLLSGLAFQLGGLGFCLAVSAFMVLVAWLSMFPLSRVADPKTA